jgi:phosphoglycerate dehydrogenase-like enzyme
MTTRRILVTPRSLSEGGHPALRRLEEAGFELVTPTPGAVPDEAALIAAVPGCLGWIAGVEPVSDRVIGAAHDLRVISRNGSGVDNLPLRTLEARGIVLRRADGANARSVAELSLALLLGGLRRVVETHEGIRAGQWPRLTGREIAGATVGVVGLGAVGAAVAELCLALGATVLGHDPFAPQDRVDHPKFRRTDLVEAVTAADAISLHVPMPENGRALLDAALLGALRPGTVLVNTARAGLVEEAALLDALKAGRLACYATDVFDPEPPPPSTLTSHPRVVLTSHIGAFTDAAVERSTIRAIDNLLEALGASAA